ncbi:probable CCR4-associated factor 1 homolog 11 [Brachypodium distachyon]|nr:probable CCR4-associated factor 1 homolog 11 [Brachypodium distachyon]|eukprot:XP_010233555.1 probable CCR4-associated factor 1 homolog 11 [Brachypodium distachyon]
MDSCFEQGPSLRNLRFKSMEQQQQQRVVFVRKVGAGNLAEELKTIRYHLAMYPCIAIDTDHPGNICSFPSPEVREEDLPATARYDVARTNIGALHVLQLGITLFDSRGNLPVLPTSPSGRGASSLPTVWQVSFSDFDLRRDLCSAPSVEYLRSQGLDFDELRARGVSARAFGAALAEYGIICGPKYRTELKWVAFGGIYDYGFLLKMLTGGKPLPDTREKFMAALAERVGVRVYDAKYVAACAGVSGGLMKVAKVLAAGAGVPRTIVAPQSERRQAGEKSLLACQVFVAIEQRFFGPSHIEVPGARIDGVHDRRTVLVHEL